MSSGWALTRGAMVLLGWHVLQPVLFFFVFCDWFPTIGTLERVFGAGIAVREAVYFLQVLTCTWANPSFLLVDIGASVLVPFGFFLGGLRTHGGDPSIGALLVPPGGVLLLIALALAAAGIKRV